MALTRKTRKTRKMTTRTRFEDTLSERFAAPTFFWLASLQLAALPLEGPWHAHQLNALRSLIAGQPRKERRS